MKVNLPVRTGLFSAGLQVSALAAGLATTILLARILGAEGYGIYVFAYASIALLAIPVQAGLPMLVLRETAKFDSIPDFAGMKGLWKWASLIALFGGVTAVFLGATVAALLLGYQEKAFLVGLALIPLIALSELRSAALKGLGHVIYGQFPDLVLRPVLLAVFLIAATLVLENVRPETAMTLHVVVAIISFTVGATILFVLAPDGLSGVRGNTGHWRVWLMSIIPMGTSSAIQVLNVNLGAVLLGMLSVSEDVSLFRIAFMVANLLMFGQVAIIAVVQPRLTRAHYSGDREHLQSLASWVSAVSLAVMLTLVTIMIFWGQSIISIVFGAEFRGVWPLVLIMATGQTVNATLGSVGSVLMMTGHERKAMHMLVMTTCLSLPTYFVLITLWGAIGAAIANALTTTVLHLMYWWGAKRVLNVDCSAIYYFVSGRKF